MRELNHIYPAIVRDVHDPMLSGRIKVECPTVYGTGPTDLDWSPWCLPAMASHLWSVPLEGDTVWIAFRMGDARYPVWLGRYNTFAQASSPPEFRAFNQGPYHDEMRDYVEHAPIVWDNNDHAKGHDHGAGEFWGPHVHALVFPMGAGLLVEEEPGEQYLRVRDRIGQYLLMEGDPILPKDPHDESRIGGEYDAPALDDESVLFSQEGLKARLRLQARHTQFLDLRVGEFDQEEELEIRSADIAGTHGSSLTFSNSEIDKRFLLNRFVPGYGQSYTAVIDPLALTTNYQQLFDSQGQSVKINSDDQSPDRYVRLQNALGELVSVEQDTKRIILQDRLGNKVVLDAEADSITAEHHTGSKATLSSNHASLTDGSGGSIAISSAAVAIVTTLATINGKPIAVDGDVCVTPAGPGSVIGTGV